MRRRPITPGAGRNPSAGGGILEAVDVPRELAVGRQDYALHFRSDLVVGFEGEGLATRVDAWRGEFKLPNDVRDFAALEFLKDKPVAQWCEKCFFILFYFFYGFRFLLLFCFKPIFGCTKVVPPVKHISTVKHHRTRLGLGLGRCLLLRLRYAILGSTGPPLRLSPPQGTTAVLPNILPLFLFCSFFLFSLFFNSFWFYTCF